MARPQLKNPIGFVCFSTNEIVGRPVSQFRW